MSFDLVGRAAPLAVGRGGAVPLRHATFDDHADGHEEQAAAMMFAAYPDLETITLFRPRAPPTHELVSMIKRGRPLIAHRRAVTLFARSSG
jgi:hypothetical protein